MVKTAQIAVGRPARLLTRLPELLTTMHTTMSEICISPPTMLAVTLEQAKLNLRVDGDYLDGLIEIWLQGIIAELEHEIGQCLMPQTWEVTQDGFGDTIGLPHPVISIESVSYLDAQGKRKELSPTAWSLSRGRYKTVLAPAAGASWPVTSRSSEAVIIRLICGHGESAESTPANIRLYILAKLVEQFDPVTRTERDTVQSTYIERLLDACRTHS